MTGDYKAVQDALAAGADPAMLCGTCPWDRYCITPPTMTSSEIDARVKEATLQDEAKARQAQALGKDPGMPVGVLMTALVYAGRDTSGQLCPVFSLRLRSSKGREIADTLKGAMRDWDDQS